VISVEAAIEAVAALAAEQGTQCSPSVLADRSNLVLRLEPHPLVARVAMATSLARVGLAWLGREVELTRYLDARGGAVTRPTAGPFERDGLVISFWQLEHVTAERADPAAAGAELARLHRLLRDYSGPLAEWGGVREAREVLGRGAFTDAERARVEAALTTRNVRLQPVHGDAHIGNALATERGVLWTDWEDAFLGPIEWDLACLRSKADLFGEEREAIDAMIAAYDNDYDEELVRELGVVRNAQVIAWLAVFAERQPELIPRMRARIERLPP
jgi:hypothetical protein